MIAEYFGVPSKEKCGRCGNCLRPVISVAVDNTLHAKQLVTCLQNMQMLKEKVSVDELAGTYIGSKGCTGKKSKI
jgi:superfamily II DNA helicase RecQ